MKIPLEVEYGDGRTEVLTPSPMAMIGWEKASGRRMTDLAGDSGGGLGMTDMVRMAYEQAKLTGSTSDEFDAWATSLADISVKGDVSDPPSGAPEA